MVSYISHVIKVPKEQKISFKIEKLMDFNHLVDKPGSIGTRFYIDGLQVHSLTLRNTNWTQLWLPTQKAYHKGFIPIKKQQTMDDLFKIQLF